MDKKNLEARLKNLKQMRENQIQDIKEIDYVIKGLEEQIKITSK